MSKSTFIWSLFKLRYKCETSSYFLRSYHFPLRWCSWKELSSTSFKVHEKPWHQLPRQEKEAYKNIQKKQGSCKHLGSKIWRYGLENGMHHMKLRFIDSFMNDFFAMIVYHTYGGSPFTISITHISPNCKTVLFSSNGNIENFHDCVFRNAMGIHAMWDQA